MIGNTNNIPKISATSGVDMGVMAILTRRKVINDIKELQALRNALNSNNFLRSENGANVYTISRLGDWERYSISSIVDRVFKGAIQTKNELVIPEKGNEKVLAEILTKGRLVDEIGERNISRAIMAAESSTEIFKYLYAERETTYAFLFAFRAGLIEYASKGTNKLNDNFKAQLKIFTNQFSDEMRKFDQLANDALRIARETDDKTVNMRVLDFGHWLLDTEKLGKEILTADEEYRKAYEELRKTYTEGLRKNEEESINKKMMIKKRRNEILALFPDINRFDKLMDLYIQLVALGRDDELRKELEERLLQDIGNVECIVFSSRPR